MIPARLKFLLGEVTAAPDAVLLKSIKHCHARHVSSIVVEENDGRQLRRCFLAWPQHELHRNVPTSDDMAVGIHDHRYGLILQHLSGDVVNYTWRRAEAADRFYEFRFRSGLGTGDQATAVLIGTTRLELVTGLYERFASREEIVEHVLEFCRLAV